MNKDTIQILTVSFAFVAGLTLSITHNPLMGLSALFCTTMVMLMSPKLIKQKIK